MKGAVTESQRPPRFSLLVIIMIVWFALQVLGGGDEIWKAAHPGYRLELPRDHASHPDHKIEWWYYTGNLSTREGRRFGYQLTFFRVGVERQPVNPSRWAVRDLFMAHFAVTDLHGRRHRFAERLNRAGVGWAGAATDRYDVWNDDWRTTLDEAGRHRLRASDRVEGIGIDLELEPGRPWIAHGEGGYSRKGSAPGNASHYYSITRLTTRGRVSVEGRSFDVEGLSWMDHEFGSSFLEATTAGWDWFSLQFDDGSDLMLYRLRTREGGATPYSSGTIVLADGRASVLRASEFEVTPETFWVSPQSNTRYPVGWRLAIPTHDISVLVEATVHDQELRTPRSTGVTYWEGSVDARGLRGTRDIKGRGYLEMTGYTGAPLSDLLR
jgi:predicted secreted hydrolase